VLFIKERAMEEDDIFPPLSCLYDDYTHIEIIGAGKFGQVFRVTSNKTGTECSHFFK
jgi:hypothetical protein